jgi:hypothetical protein
MFTENFDSKQFQTSESKERDAVVRLYRGIGKKIERERAGAWWSTNPYYALRYSNAGGGEMFVAFATEEQLVLLAKDVSIESDYQNYFFREQDPPKMRSVTAQEIDELKSYAQFHKQEIGAVTMKPPENFIEIGNRIFKE